MRPLSTEDPTNCNAYDAKTDVWVSGLPVGLPEGDYFVAVLAPGGQNDVEGPKLLSTDSRAARSFSVDAGGVLSSAANAARIATNRFQLAPFADSPNQGGVYIAAVCRDVAAPTSRDCAFDAFKVKGVETAQPLSVEKDAAGSYTRTHDWSIAKSASKTQIETTAKTADVDYTVTVERTTTTDTDVLVEGTITVTNENLDDVVATVTDALSDGTDCTVENGVDVAFAFGMTELDYSCSLGAVPTAPLGNTVTVTWATQTLGGGAVLEAGSATGTVENIAFAKTELDECVEVTDAFNGGTAEALGTVCADQPNPTTYTYSRTLESKLKPTCGAYGNTATYITNDSKNTDSASVTVTVCRVPLPTNARTIGFWSNPNGQTLLKGSPVVPGTSVCSVTPVLRAYKPFTDLGTNSTCAQVNTYVQNTIKAANASGAAMNAMLKAQMLATALDVHVTGDGSTAATLKFFERTNLGGQSIDLTLIKGRSSAAAFGGATSLTIQQVLNHAATQINDALTLWYGNVKATQELAKDVFDAINNNIVYGG